ncbi:MAG TPA: hypothetical protein VFP97_12255 [Chitinophagaceae bacterium]|nr:hypothetical protein [Chitinophagaceae bacterium]
MIYSVNEFSFDRFHKDPRDARGLAVVIAFMTIGLQGVKAAIANPVKSLRTE